MCEWSKWRRAAAEYGDNVETNERVSVMVAVVSIRFQRLFSVGRVLSHPFNRIGSLLHGHSLPLSQLSRQQYKANATRTPPPTSAPSSSHTTSAYSSCTTCAACTQLDVVLRCVTSAIRRSIAEAVRAACRGEGTVSQCAARYQVARLQSTRGDTTTRAVGDRCGARSDRPAAHPNDAHTGQTTARAAADDGQQRGRRVSEQQRDTTRSR